MLLSLCTSEAKEKTDRKSEIRNRGSVHSRRGREDGAEELVLLHLERQHPGHDRGEPSSCPREAQLQRSSRGRGHAGDVQGELLQRRVEVAQPQAEVVRRGQVLVGRQPLRPRQRLRLRVGQPCGVVGRDLRGSEDAIVH